MSALKIFKNEENLLLMRDFIPKIFYISNLYLNLGMSRTREFM